MSASRRETARYFVDGARALLSKDQFERWWLASALVTDQESLGDFLVRLLEDTQVEATSQDAEVQGTATAYADSDDA